MSSFSVESIVSAEARELFNTKRYQMRNNLKLPTCFGILWLKTKKDQPLKICKSKEMAPKTDGWRTMMKIQGNLQIVLELNA